MRKQLTVGAVSFAALFASGTAAAFWWDIDMVDAYFVRAYEAPMRDLPEGVVSTNRYAGNSDRMTPEGQALTNPYPQDEASLAKGKVMFETYCETCHGTNGQGGAQVAYNDPAAGINRYPVMPALLSGPGNSVAARTDGYLYLTIRNGAAVMKGYSHSMDDHEMWATVQYMRTLPGAAYTPPAEPETDSE